MKRLALMLASILVVSSVATAKEVIAQPAVIEEPIMVEEVAVVEEPAVIPEQPAEFKSTGYIQLQTKYYGKGEHRKIQGNYTRTELRGVVNLTEKDEFYFRSRIYDNLNSADSKQATTSDRSRNDLRWWHDLGKLSDTKIGVRTQLHYEQRKTFKRGTAYLEFQFSDYMAWSPEWFKNENFLFTPKVRYVKSEGGDSNYYTRLGADLYTNWALPLGFGFEWNTYFNHENYGTVAEINKGYKKANDFTTEFYLTNRWTLAQSMDEKTKLTFGFEGGLDDYGNYQHDNAEGKNQDYYEYYAELDLRVDHKVNNSLGVFVYAGAEYRNFEFSAVDSAKDWRWRPMGGAGFKATF